MLEKLIDEALKVLASGFADQQVTLGHNFVADRCAWAPNPQPLPNHTPNLPPTHCHVVPREGASRQTGMIQKPSDSWNQIETVLVIIIMIIISSLSLSRSSL